MKGAFEMSVDGPDGPIRTCTSCGSDRVYIQMRKVTLRIGDGAELQVSGMAHVHVCAKCSFIFLPFRHELGGPVVFEPATPPPPPQSKGAPKKGGKKGAKKKAVKKRSRR